MTIHDFNKYPQRYINATELKAIKQTILLNGFQERKYNQVNYIWGVLTKLDNIVKTKDGKITLSDYANQVATDDSNTTEGRDPCLHRIYKSQLIREADNTFGKTVCMLEYLKYHRNYIFKDNKGE